jgi:hypothetical protein
MPDSLGGGFLASRRAGCLDGGDLTPHHEGPGEGNIMPLEPDDLHISPEQENLNRQLEALQRYVSGLQQQREHAKDAAQPPPAPRPSSRWLLLTGLLVVLALVGGVVVGAVAWSDDRPTGAAAGASSASPVSRQPSSISTAAQGSNPTTTALVASLACKTAVNRANTMLATAVALQRELAEYRTIMSDPSNRELSGREVVEKTLPGLGAGARESARLDQALSAYRQVVDQCKLQKP